MDIRNKIIDHVLNAVVIEELRDACYFADKLHNVLQEQFLGKYCFMRCGSYAKGMMNHGDIDNMYIIDDFLVVEHSDNIPKRGTVLLLKPDQCYPGYTRLELYHNTPSNQLEIYSNQDGKLYLDWIKFLKNMLGLGKIIKRDMHGTALPGFDESGKLNVDSVRCFHCPMWSAFARREFHFYQNNKNLKMLCAMDVILFLLHTKEQTTQFRI